MDKALTAIIITALIYALICGSTIPWTQKSMNLAECMDPNLEYVKFEQMSKKCGYVFDEIHYVRAAYNYLNGIAINLEHPPLAKALIAASLKILGTSPTAWRLPSVIFFFISLLSIGLITRHFTDRVATIILAQTFLALDTVVFLLGGLAMLDIFLLGFTLLAVFSYFKGRWKCSAIFIGLAMLTKSSGLFLLPIIPLHKLLDKSVPLKKWFMLSVQYILTALTVYFAGLAIFTSYFHISPTPVHYFVDALKYISSVTIGTFTGDFIMLFGSNPLDWILGKIKIYPVYDEVLETANLGKIHIKYVLVTPYTWVFQLPCIIYQAYLTLRFKENIEYFTFTVIWILFTYAPYIVLFNVLHRFTMKTYHILTISMIYVGYSLLGEKSGCHRFLLLCILLMEIFWFLHNFPIRTEFMEGFL